ncbi:MAG: glycerol-3-phosphate acyltransferase, partial [Gemmatimonadota bacterium]
MLPIVALAIGYLAGSIPFAYLAGRLLKGIDLRTVGSGNLGATNVYRTLGAPAAIVVLLLDALKGALPVLLLPGLVTNLRPG